MLELQVSSRSVRGKKVRHLRKEGLLPGVVYGQGMESTPVEVPYFLFEKVYQNAGPGTLVQLKIKGIEDKTKEGIPVFIQEPARDVLTDKFIHVDFYTVRLDRPIRISLPLEFEGSSPAVEQFGGTLVKNMYEVEVEGLPLELPKEIVVDVSRLNASEDKILIQDLSLPQNIKMFEDPEQVVVFVEAPRTQEELEALEEKPEEKVEGVEVEGEKEREEKGEAGEEEKGRAEEKEKK